MFASHCLLQPDLQFGLPARNVLPDSPACHPCFAANVREQTA
jgi:hypothetical protein